jgi:quinol monooxygenase YgiN
MAYVVTARWVAKAGEEALVLNAVRAMITPSRAEPGCLFYQPHSDPEDSRIFYFYEQYVDADAYKAHAESAHFKAHALDLAIPRLESRERAFYETLAD